MSERRLGQLFELFRRTGDASALAEVFDELAPTLLRVARHLAHDRAEAEDLVQATFLVAIEKRATFDSTRALAPWLSGILLKQAALARRARARTLEPDRLATRAGEDPLDALAARELADALAAALAKLAPTDREVLVPLLLDGRRAVEIARELGRRPDTVHMRIHRGLARLRRLLPASFGLAALLRLEPARGLGRVRHEVLHSARVSLGGGASTLSTAIGITMATKLGLGVAAFILCAAVGIYLAAQGGEADGVSSSTGAGELAAMPSETRRAPNTAVETASERTLAVVASVKAPLAASDALEVELLREEREPAAGALVALVDSSGALASATADASGLCTFAASAGSGALFVRDDGRLPFHTTIELAVGRRTVELPRGGELSGRLELDGQPFPSIELSLSTDRAPEGFAGARSEVFGALALVEYGSARIVARTRPSSDGSFRFRGLPETWSGALSLPRELVFVDASRPSRSSEKVFTGSATELRIPIAYRPRIIGRLVDASTGAPIAESRFGCAIGWANGNSMIAGGRADGSGRFTIALEHDTDAVELTILGVDAAGGRRAFAPLASTWTGPCEPFDAGDIQCQFPPSRALVFHALDPQRRPLAGARARIGGGGIVTADDEGVGTFAAVPFDEREMRVAASGHSIAVVPLTESTTTPLEVVLAPTNRLTICLSPTEVGRKNLGLELVSEVPLFDGRSSMYETDLRGDKIGSCFTASVYDNRHAVRFRFSEDGRVEVEDVRAGITFRAHLMGSSKAGPLSEIVVEPLGPQEQRRIQFAISPSAARTLQTLSGRALDEQGSPILGATISLQIPTENWGQRTDLDGRFRVDTGRDSVDLEVAKRGFVPFRARALDCATSGPIEALLRRGADLRVEIVDARGRPLDGASVQADVAGFGAPWQIEPGAPGVFTLCDLPAGSATITVDIAGATYERSHDAHSGLARIVLPQHGRVEATWRRGVDEKSSRLQIALRPIGEQGAAQVAWISSRARVDRHVFENVLPGEYTLGLEVGSSVPASDELLYAPLRTPVRVEVVGGTTRVVDLGP